jgi:hypothetical protein
MDGPDLKDVAPATASYSLFMGSLPAGRYEVKDLTSPGGGNAGILIYLLSTSSQTSQGKLQSFTVVPGQVNNLGVIVAASSLNPKLPKFDMVTLTGEEHRTVVRDALAPSALEKIKGLKEVGWDTTFEAQIVQSKLTKMRSLFSMSPHIEPTHDGKILVAGALGVVQIVGFDGTKTLLQTPTNNTIRYATELADRRIMASEDDGQYYVSDNARVTWKAYRLPDTSAQLTRVFSIPDKGYIFQELSENKPSAIHTASSYVRREDIDAGIDSGTKIGQSVTAFEFGPMAFVSSQGFHYFVNSQGISRKSELVSVSLTNQNQTRAEYPFWVMQVLQRNGHPLTVERVNGISRFLSRSNDEGKTWIELDTRGVYFPFFLDRKIGYSLDNSARGLDVRRTEDGGVTWKIMGNVPDYGGATGYRIAATTTENVAIVGSGNLMLSTDGGKSWTISP